MIYASTLSAVVSALAAEAIDNTSKQAWQKLYQPGYAEGGDLATLIRSASSDSIGRDMADCWVHARLHSQLKPRHWNALVAKYSTHKAKKVQAIAALCPVIASHAPQLFVYKAVTAWAIPPLKGLQSRTGREIVSRSAKDLSTAKALSAAWEREGLSGMASTEADRSEYVKRSTDMIVLPPAFYDLNTWDLDARPESTRRRWRGDIQKKLEGLVSEALAEAQSILSVEGVLLQEAA